MVLLSCIIYIDGVYDPVIIAILSELSVSVINSCNNSVCDYHCC